jgi:hypothetical protein
MIDVPLGQNVIGRIAKYHTRSQYGRHPAARERRAGRPAPSEAVMRASSRSSATLSRRRRPRNRLIELTRRLEQEWEQAVALHN